MKDAVLAVSVDGGVDALREAFEQNEGRPNWLHVSHEGIGASDANLMLAARRDSRARVLLDEVTNRGFYSFRVEDSVTRLVHEESIRYLWSQVKDGSYAITPDDVVHLLQPAVDAPARKLVVVFSAMGTGMADTSINRYFVHYFKKLQKFIAKDIAVLRIADLGGVKGAFYRDTTFQPRNFDRIAGLIDATAKELGLDRRQVVLLGGSKGATGALYHGLHGGFPFLSVDPIVSDDFYESTMADAHYTGSDIYPCSKQELTSRLVKEFKVSGKALDDVSRIVLTSSRSPQFPYIEPLLVNELRSELTFLDATTNRIVDHGSVLTETLHIQTMALNALLFDLGTPTGVLEMP